MKTFFSSLLAIFMALMLASCNKGSSATPPATITVVPGDGIATITWSMAPGVEYWLFYAASDSISTKNWISLPAAKNARPVSSPYVVTGLTNGTTYAFTLNGRVNGGPGGEGTPSQAIVPRLAGNSWNVGMAAANDLLGVARGTNFVAVGANGSVLLSADGKSWTAQNSATKATLNTIVYGGGYVAAGVAGTIVSSSDGITWASQTSSTVNDLYGLAANGSFYLAVGANGTILSSNGGTTWTTAASGTSNALYGVTYANGRYVAVGASGTILTSTDAVTWQTIAPLTASDLRSVAYGYNGTSNVFVAMGANGTLLTSSDGLTWIAQPSIASNPTINAVTYNTQFVAVGNNGVIMTSTNAIDWRAATIAPNTSSNLRAVRAGNYGYVSVGLSGVNLTSY